MGLKKKHFQLTEVAEKLGCTLSDLIHVGAIGELPIYALADGWSVNIFGIVVSNGTDDYGRSTLVENPPLKKSPFPFVITGPVEMYPDTLRRYEANPRAREYKFIAPTPDQKDEFDRFEYQLVDGSHGQDLSGKHIGECLLVVMLDDVKKLIPQAGADLDKHLGAREKDTLLKLVIGLAIGGYGYDPKAAKNMATQEIVNDLRLRGISMDADTVKKWLKQGALLLPSKGQDI